MVSKIVDLLECFKTTILHCKYALIISYYLGLTRLDDSFGQRAEGHSHARRLRHHWSQKTRRTASTAEIIARAE
jgi:hypothetical protein